MNTFDLSGRVALVTGAGRGLGRAAAMALAEAGATVALAARSIDQLEQVAAELRSLGRLASVHALDVRVVDQISSVVADVAAQHGQLDILVNNAGMKIPEFALDVTEAAWDDVMSTNLKGTFFCAQAAARVMVEQGYGKIVNVASTYAIVGAPGRATYAASKGGVLQLTRVMAIELASRGVNVNAIGPTATNTAMNAGLFEGDDWRTEALSRIPAGRFCEPEDIAGAVVFLASRASDMVNGHLLLIDGAFTAA